MRVRKRREDIRSAEAGRQARRRGLAARLCLAAATLGLLLLSSSAQAVEVPRLTGATGPTGPAGPTGPQGERGPTGPAGGGTGGSGSGRETSAGTLASGAAETGLWSATIVAVKGFPQVQADAVISFPIKLEKSEELEGVNINYRNGEQALSPTKPCLGSVNEPVAEKANLCAYRGIAGIGSEEKEDKGVGGKPPGTSTAPAGFEDAFGQTLTKIEGAKGQDGVDIVFRTNQFNTAGGEPATLTENAYMVAKGSWTVTAK
jgi:hypothetical protein